VGLCDEALKMETTRSSETLVSMYSTSPHGVTTQKMNIDVFRAVRTYNCIANSCFIGAGVAQASEVSDYGQDDWAIEVRSPAGQRIFPLSSVSRPSLRPTQPPVQWVPGSFPWGYSEAGA
jgi:hypothetical protein